MIYQGFEDVNVGRYFSATIFDISSGGICMAFPLEKSSKNELIKSESMYEIIFQLNKHKTIYRIMCKAVYIKINNYVVRVGGCFIESKDFKYEQLNMQLSQRN